MRVAIANPRAWGSKRMAMARADKLVKSGKAVWLRPGLVQITDPARLRYLDIETRHEIGKTLEAAQCEIQAEVEFRHNRGGVLYWNGARAVYDTEGRDVIMFPPGCNVLFPKAWSSRAVHRYC